MNELIKVNYTSDRPTVSARDLHEFLEVGADYRHWFPRMCEYGFTESTGGRPAQDAQLTKDEYNRLYDIAAKIYGKRYEQRFRKQMSWR